MANDETTRKTKIEKEAYDLSDRLRKEEITRKAQLLDEAAAKTKMEK